MSNQRNEASNDVQRAEEAVKAQSKVLTKQLGLMDLVFAQILGIVGLSWVGIAGKLGPSHVVYWLLAVLLFYIPSGAVVIYLSRLMPIEGGLYQWAKFAFNDFMGFFVAWSLWGGIVVLMSGLGLSTATNLAYALGPRAAWMAANKAFIGAMAFVIVASLVLLSIRGLGVGKWLHNAGGFILVVIFGALIILPFIQPGRVGLRDYHPFALAMPAISLFSLNILGKMGLGALGGFEYVAIFAGESRDPGRTIGRSVAIAAPIIALMFILGTASVLRFVRPGDIDLIGPIPQVLSLGTRSFGIAAQTLVPIIILVILASRLANASLVFQGCSRMPMVAGWDRLLPGWFTRLHPRFRTPVNSILFAAALILGLALVALAGVGQQEAFQLLENSAGSLYAFTYLVMFAIPLVGWKKIAPRPPLALRIAALSGFLMTLLFVVFAIIPIIPVANRFLFTAKILGGIIVASGIGVAIYAMAGFRRSRGRETPDAARS